jgi:8-oxo-dGTP pyrophosphatase MutT (NUDIX family)
VSGQALARSQDNLHRTVRVIISDGDKVLVGKKRSKNRLQPCTGHVEEGETTREAAVREAEEEMLDSRPREEALSEIRSGVVREGDCRYTDSGLLPHEYTVYSLELQDPALDIGEEEFSSLKWRTVDELIRSHESGEERLTQNSYKDIKKYREWTERS